MDHQEIDHHTIIIIEIIMKVAVVQKEEAIITIIISLMQEGAVVVIKIIEAQTTTVVVGILKYHPVVTLPAVEQEDHLIIKKVRAAEVDITMITEMVTKTQAGVKTDHNTTEMAVTLKEETKDRLTNPQIEEETEIINIDPHTNPGKTDTQIDSNLVNMAVQDRHLIIEGIVR